VTQRGDPQQSKIGPTLRRVPRGKTTPNENRDRRQQNRHHRIVNNDRGPDRRVRSRKMNQRRIGGSRKALADKACALTENSKDEAQNHFSDLGENQNNEKEQHTREVTAEKQHHSDLVQTQRGRTDSTHQPKKTSFSIEIKHDSYNHGGPSLPHFIIKMKIEFLSHLYSIKYKNEISKWQGTPSL
jgi:hypothetical protein